MKVASTLYHLVKASFLEQSRRYSFLITLGLVIAVGYAFAPGQEAGYAAGVLLYDREAPTALVRGVFNSAWIGSMVALLTTTLLSLPGFYLVKGSVEQDRRTGVGEVLAATSLGKITYALGRWLGNTALLVAMMGVLAVVSLLMQLIRGESLPVNLWALLAPFLFVVLPALSLVAAVAVLFDASGWLSGGLGNVLYFFLWGWVVTSSLGGEITGWDLIVSHVEAAAQAAFPQFTISSSIGINPREGSLHFFQWSGIQWTLTMVMGRLVWVPVAAGIALVAAAIFDRFDPAGLHRINLGRWVTRRQHERASLDGQRESPSQVRPGPDILVATIASPAALTAVPVRFRILTLVAGELRLLLKGIPWWWYAVMLGLVASFLVTPLELLGRYFLPLAWIWPLLLWSNLGAREAYHRTTELVFTAPHPVRRQLLASWLAGVIVTVAAGAGAAARLALLGDWLGLWAWAAAALFIPTLALTLGIWTGGRKLFEVVYTVLWYVGPLNQTAALNFMGTTADAMARAQPWLVPALTLGLMAVALVGRRRRIP